MSNCGECGESCCTSLEVTGGTYFQDYYWDGDAGTPAGEIHPATVSRFRLDKYLVTVGRFRNFVNAVIPPDGGAGWKPAAGSGKHTYLNGGQGLVADTDPTDADPSPQNAYEPGWVTADDSNIAPSDANLTTVCNDPSGDSRNSGPSYATWTPLPAGHEDLPINCVNSYEAYAFCIWDGGFLPSNAEWGYAAAGGAEQRLYPWGSNDPGMTSQYTIYGCHYPSGSGPCAGVVNIAAVGTAARGVGLWGQLDLSGDVEQWVLDWAYSSSPCMDCAVWSQLPTTRGDRGSAFDSDAVYQVSVTGGSGDAAGRYQRVGFRCARTP